MSARAVVVHPDAETLAEAVAARLALAIADAQAVASPVHVVLTGGTAGTASLAALGRSPLLGLVDRTSLHVWWGDERFLPAGDPDRNETQARAALLDVLDLPAGNVHAVPGPDVVGSPEDAAAAYAAELAAHAPDGATVPGFAVLLLGVGPDAHVASLFPGQPALDVTGVAAVGVQGAPKPPPERVSLTFEAIAAAHQVWFVVAGADKADAVRAGLGGVDVHEAPVSGAHGHDVTLWLLDVAAAGSEEDDG
ncbi:6-phosphogluconolactonase [Beutenbergia cavernae DSM 12333]|uniref:6-phosphogluconolactonase n=1 Tax=Beutenbergia cavernae (strain ATCC BAA-8 / DSM 12333 / CCUG 43141 / JCM 11478 / NBRC 16432 / NCIMB 13614 / HKI 0122) TaxID=471853 RepID=C5BV30_BEUC1|nr:6-phosphogluconolactonase [Beutenbergia cavernae]ACQ80417.1 6-phosphogluconolactonase [Beutenbergia cavernae DSM 12333]